jgi:hypothetical protein
MRHAAEVRFAKLHETSGANQQTAIAGLAPTPPPPAANELIRVEPALPMETPKVAVAPPPPPPAPTAQGKGKKVAKNQKISPTPSPKAPMVAAQKATPPPPAAPSARPLSPAPAVAAATPAAPPQSQPPVVAAQPVTDNALASTAGGANWKTFPPGKMPVGRLIGTADVRDLVDRGVAGERVYLKGQFVVNFTEANRAVLRPKTKITDAVLHPGSGAPSMRVIVEFPAGYAPPQQGSIVSRDEARPYEITEVRKQSDGQLNVFVREIMQ